MSKKKKNKNKNKSYSGQQITVKRNSFESFKSCHEPTEIIPNLYLCKEIQIYDLIKTKKIDVLVPLADLEGKIWDLGFTGEILYYPIKDYDCLPQNILSRCVTEIISRLKTKKVAVFCMGGHGRTGYIGACILGKMGYDDPIRAVRNKYCKSAIECNEQIDSIATFLNNPKLSDLYTISPLQQYGLCGAYSGIKNYGLYDYDYGYGYNNSYSYSQPYSYSCKTPETEDEEYGIEAKHIVTKPDFSLEEAKAWYVQDCEASGYEADWDEMDTESQQILYDAYYKEIMGY